MAASHIIEKVYEKMLRLIMRLICVWAAAAPLVTSFSSGGNGGQIKRHAAVSLSPSHRHPITLRRNPHNTHLLLAKENNNNEDFDDEMSLSGMISRSSSSSLPETSFGAAAVPEGQRPANEYLDLIRQPLFGWAAQDKGNKGLLIRLAVVYVVIFLIVGFPIAGATYTQDGYLLQKVAAANVGSMSLILALLVRLYSGWGYVGTRLKSRVVEYEETGWYDGSFEEKSPKEKARDLFLYRSDVQPVEHRIKLFTGITAALWIASIVGLNVANSAKPIFDEYDVKMLQELQYNEKMADVAAQQSGGRPTYCDNRYYRAIANGGQGCN